MATNKAGVLADGVDASEDEHSAERKVPPNGAYPLATAEEPETTVITSLFEQLREECVRTDTRNSKMIRAAEQLRRAAVRQDSSPRLLALVHIKR
jgi:hypothetical protein